MGVTSGFGRMSKLILGLSLLLLTSSESTGGEADLLMEIETLYHEMGLHGSLDRDAFSLAVIGLANLYDQGILQKHTPLAIIDYSKPSTEKRLVIVDIAGRRLLNTSLVAHGKNSGENYATRFSNEPGSLSSSFGFYTTGETYYGKHGYSLRLHGLEQEYNGNALKRFIVIHGAWYVSQKFIDGQGRLGRSWGCPTLPLDTAAEIIDLIKGGGCVYIHADDPTYLENSIFLDKRRAADWFIENGGLWDAGNSQKSADNQGGIK